MHIFCTLLGPISNASVYVCVFVVVLDRVECSIGQFENGQVSALSTEEQNGGSFEI